MSNLDEFRDPWRCVIPGCHELVVGALAMCREHWMQVPVRLRVEWYRTNAHHRRVSLADIMHEAAQALTR